jgi:transposase
MLSPEEDVEAHALHRRGWTISAIARHLGCSRATVRAYLNNARTPGQRRESRPDWFDPYEEYVAARLREDPHVWATALYDEVRELGYARSYPRFTLQLRRRGLRPHCEPCAGVRGRATIEIEHPPGDEIQWDFLELPSPWSPKSLHVLVGTLAYSGRMRAVFCESEDQAHVIRGIDAVLRRLGGTARTWRFDRMAAVVTTSTGRVLPSFREAAKYYGVSIAICPPRRANRKGVVESRNHFIAQRWWRTATVRDVDDAQASLDTFCIRVGDALPRHDTIVRAAATREQLMPPPAQPFPVCLSAERRVDRFARVAYEGNLYAVSPALIGRQLTLRLPLDGETLTIENSSGTVVATHRRAHAGSGAVVRTPEQRAELEHAVLSSFTTARPCRRKQNQPPGAEALAAAAALRARVSSGAETVSVDLQRYADAAEGTR